MRANDRRVIREHVPLEVEEVIDQADGPHTYLSAKFPLLDARRPARTRSARSRPTSRSASAPRRRCASRSATSAGSSTRRTTRSSRWTRPGASPPGTRRPRRPSAGPSARRSDATCPRRSSRRATASTHNRGARAVHRDRARARCSAGASSSRRMHRDGHEFPVEFTISAVKVGGTYAFNAFLHDITERKQAEETLRRLADVVQSSHDAIIATGPRGEITAWNARRRRAVRLRGRGGDRPHARRADAARARARTTRACCRRRSRAGASRTTRPSTGARTAASCPSR